jgi:hypothetical protein
VVRHIFQACPVWKYTQSNIKSILFTWVHYTITANITGKHVNIFKIKTVRSQFSARYAGLKQFSAWYAGPARLRQPRFLAKRAVPAVM